MSGLLSSLTGIKTRDQKAADNNMNTGVSNLKNVFNYAMPLAQDTAALSKTNTASGFDTLNSSMEPLNNAKSYWGHILSGSRPEQLAAAAPEINAINDQASAARTGDATFGTSRGGGSNAAAQESEFKRQAQIDNALFATRPAAATATEGIARDQANIGSAKASIGNQQLAQALQALGLSEQDATALMNGGMQQGVNAFNMNQALAKNLGSLIGFGADMGWLSK